MADVFRRAALERYLGARSRQTRPRRAPFTVQAGDDPLIATPSTGRPRRITRPQFESITAVLERVVDDWLAAGKRVQPGIVWLRERWHAEFPEHAAIVTSLPDRIDRAAPNVPGGWTNESEGLAPLALSSRTVAAAATVRQMASPNPPNA